MGRGDVDHPPPPPLVHTGQDRASEEERRLDHEAVHEPPVVGRELVHRMDALHACVVDQDVDVVEAQVVELTSVAQVDHPDPAAHRVGDPLSGGLVESGGTKPACEVEWTEFVPLSVGSESTQPRVLTVRARANSQRGYGRRGPGWATCEYTVKLVPYAAQ